MKTTKITLPEPIGVGNHETQEVEIRCPTMTELADAGDMMSVGDDPTQEERDAVTRHNTRTFNNLIRISLTKIKGQDISSLTLDNLSIANGMVLRNEMSKILGESFRLVSEHLGLDEAEGETKE